MPSVFPVWRTESHELCRLEEEAGSDLSPCPGFGGQAGHSWFPQEPLANRIPCGSTTWGRAPGGHSWGCRESKSRQGQQTSAGTKAPCQNQSARVAGWSPTIPLSSSRQWHLPGPGGAGLTLCRESFQSRSLQGWVSQVSVSLALTSSCTRCCWLEAACAVLFTVPCLYLVYTGQRLNEKSS